MEQAAASNSRRAAMGIMRQGTLCLRSALYSSTGCSRWRSLLFLGRRYGDGNGVTDRPGARSRPVSGGAGWAKGVEYELVE